MQPPSVPSLCSSVFFIFRSHPTIPHKNLLTFTSIPTIILLASLPIIQHLRLALQIHISRGVAETPVLPDLPASGSNWLQLTEIDRAPAFKLRPLYHPRPAHTASTQTSYHLTRLLRDRIGDVQSSSQTAEDPKYQRHTTSLARRRWCQHNLPRICPPSPLRGMSYPLAITSCDQDGAADVVEGCLTQDENDADAVPQTVEEVEQHNQSWPIQLRPTYTQPEAETSAALSSRNTSSSSVSSDYLRSEAFSRHRDTLARIHYTPSDRKSTSATTSSTASMNSTACSAFPGHRDTLALIKFRTRPAPQIPEKMLITILSFLGFEEYKALRLTCREWCSLLPKPSLSPSYHLPGEIIQQIFQYLSPLEFDAARHTCKSWFIASLDQRILKMMARRAGCLNSVQTDLDLLQARRTPSLSTQQFWTDDYRLEIENELYLEGPVSEDWVFSKRLEIESALSSRWKGLGLKSGDDRMTLIGSMSFRELSGDCGKEERLFTVSSCGKYVLVTYGLMVLVYSMLKSSLQPITCIVCPRRVLAVSMDTSSDRYAVAVLMEGRLGLCCNLAPISDGGYPFSHGEALQLGMSTDVSGSCRTARLPSYRAGYRVAHRSETSFSPSLPQATILPLRQGSAGGSSLETGEQVTPEALDGQEEGVEQIAVPVESGPRAMYKNLCSFDDPPRSVAICPQRRCVAFGCRMGIELRWVDALTGSDLNRWFPLAAPSDFLYFLPTREGVDSAKKLRLISSAACPSDESLQRRESMPSPWDWSSTLTSATTSSRGRARSMTRLFFGNLTFPSAATLSSIWPGSDQVAHEHQQAVLRTVDCDHYRAVPLSDGAHLLFTEPDSNQLCLGSDAPLGGPTKLLRKVVCLPPQQTEESQVASLICYSAGQELQWGIHIAAAYSDGCVMLYHVPSDCFERLKHTRTGMDQWDENAGVLAESDLTMDEWMFSIGHENASTSSYAANEAGSTVTAEEEHHVPPFRPIQLHGTEVGRMPRETIEDLAVDCRNGSLSVWAFTASGDVRIWGLATGPVSHTWVGRNGLVRDTEDVSPGKRNPDPEDKEPEKHIRWQLDGAADEEVSPQREERQEPPPARLRQFYRVREESAASRTYDLGNRSCALDGREETHERLEITIMSDWRGHRLLDVSANLMCTTEEYVVETPS